MKRKLTLALILFLTPLALVFTLTRLDLARAQGLDVSVEKTLLLDDGFSFQGRLTDGSGQVTDSCDFNFGLWDAPSAGAQVGITETHTTVSVDNGIFTVLLNDTADFGSEPFTGSVRWLGVGVRCPAGGGLYQPLAPRLALSPVPYAIWANTAPWSGLDGVPAGFADGIDDGADYANVIVVAKAGGDFTSIQAAVDSITNATSLNPYLVWVAPGIYTEAVTMTSWVDIEGAGQHATKITYQGSADFSDATVLGADNAALRNIAVENTGGDTYGIAIVADGTSPDLVHVTASATANNFSGGLRSANGAAPSIQDLTATAFDAAVNYGIALGDSSPVMVDVEATASGGNESYALSISNSDMQATGLQLNASGGLLFNRGIWISNASSPVIHNLSVVVSGTQAVYGIQNVSTGSPSFTDLTVQVTGGSSQSIYGIFNDGGAPSYINATVDVTGGTTSYGVYSEGTAPTFNTLNVSASGADVNYGIYNDAGSGTFHNATIAASGGTSSVGIYNTNGSTARVSRASVTASGSEDSTGVYNSDAHTVLSHAAITATAGITGNAGINSDSDSTWEISFVNVFAQGGEQAFGIRMLNSTAAMRHVSAEAAGGETSYGIAIAAFTPYTMSTLTNVRASASGITTTYGIYNANTDSSMTDVTADAEGGDNAYGIFNSGGSPTMANVSAAARNATSANFGVYNENGSDSLMSNVTSLAEGGPRSYSVYNYESSPTIYGSSLLTRGATFNFALYNEAGSGTYTVTVELSSLYGDSATVFNYGEFTTFIGGGLMYGGNVGGVGGGELNVTCVGVTDENYAFFQNTCP